MAEIECARQQGPVADLAPGPGPHEAPQMRIQGAIVLCRLHLETPERTDLALDSDEAGRKGSEDAVNRLRSQVFVREMVL